MRYFLLIVFGLFLIILQTNAQVNESKNIVSLDLVGSSVLYSLNYERAARINETIGISGKLGVGLIRQLVLVPSEIGVVISKNKVGLDVGAAYTYQKIFDRPGKESVWPLGVYHFVFGRVGLRGVSNRVLYKLAWTPLLKTHSKTQYVNTTLLWFGATLGYTW